jgi:hypothetical protein
MEKSYSFEQNTMYVHFPESHIKKRGWGYGGGAEFWLGEAGGQPYNLFAHS